MAKITNGSYTANVTYYWNGKAEVRAIGDFYVKDGAIRGNLYNIGGNCVTGEIKGSVKQEGDKQVLDLEDRITGLCATRYVHLEERAEGAYSGKWSYSPDGMKKELTSRIPEPVELMLTKK